MGLNEVQFVSGLKELDEKLKNFPAKVEQKALRGALRRGGLIFKKEIVRTAPDRKIEPAKRIFPKLKNSIAVTSKFRRERDVAIRVKVGPNRKAMPVAWWYELGTGPKRKRTAGERLTQKKNARLYRALQSMGQRAREWLAPAFLRKRGEALNAIIDEMRKKVERLARD